MAYVTVPKDLTHVKSKVLFGLTKRQLVCFGGALLTGGPLYIYNTEIAGRRKCAQKPELKYRIIDEKHTGS